MPVWKPATDHAVDRRGPGRRQRPSRPRPSRTPAPGTSARRSSTSERRAPSRLRRQGRARQDRAGREQRHLPPHDPGRAGHGARRRGDGLHLGLAEEPHPDRRGALGPAPAVADPRADDRLGDRRRAARADGGRAGHARPRRRRASASTRSRATSSACARARRTRTATSSSPATTTPGTRAPTTTAARSARCFSVVEANKDVAPAYTMIYIGWGAEEPGLVGSYDWIHRHQDLIRKIVAEHQPRGDRDRDVLERRAHRRCRARRCCSGRRRPRCTRSRLRRGANAVMPPVIPIAAYRAPERRHHRRPTSRASTRRACRASRPPRPRRTTTRPRTRRTRSTSTTSSARRASSRDLVANVQAIPPEGFALREVPTVKVSAPPRPRPGAAVPVDITLTGVDGRPIAATASSCSPTSATTGRSPNVATGPRRRALPLDAAGRQHRRGRHPHPRDDIDDGYLANGFAAIDQRAGGLLGRRGLASAAAGGSSPCTSTARLSRSRRVTRLRVTTSAGRATRQARQAPVRDPPRPAWRPRRPGDGQADRAHESRDGQAGAHLPHVRPLGLIVLLALLPASRRPPATPAPRSSRRRCRPRSTT